MSLACRIRFKASPEPEVKGTFRQDVPIDEAVKEKKTAEIATTAPEPKVPATKEEDHPLILNLMMSFTLT